MLQELATKLNKKYKWNVIPMKSLIRDKEGRKIPKMIDWQQYKSEPYPLDEWKPEYKALAIITGRISNLSILDVDSQEAMDSMLNYLNMELDDVAEYIIKTSKGYQLFYTYTPNTKTKIGLKDQIDFLSGGVTFAHPTNPGYILIKEGIPKSIPQEIYDYIMLKEDEDTKDFEAALKRDSDLPYIKPLHYLIKDFLNASRISGKLKKGLEGVFCNKEYSSLNDYALPGQIHAATLSAGALVASNPTVSPDLYKSFMKKWSTVVAKLDISDPHEAKLLANRVKGNEKIFSYNPDWQLKEKTLQNPITQAKKAGFEAWYDPEKDTYTLYEYKSGRKMHVSRPSIKEMLARRFNEEQQEELYKASDIDTMKLPEKTETFDPTVDTDFFTNEYGDQVFNNFKRSPMLSHFQTVEPQPQPPEFIGKLLEHIYPQKEEREMFLHTLAYHMTYLVVSPTTYVLTGQSGTGKNIMMQDVLQEIYGCMYLKVSAKTLTGRFRSQLKNKLLVFIDEVNEKGFKPTEQGSLHNVIKQIVANKEITIESKGKDEETYPNHALFTMASNRDEPFKLEEGFDRRINITKTRDENLRTLEWFPKHLSTLEIDKLVKSEVPDFVAYLASIDLDHHKWSSVIDNKQRRNLINSSVPLVDQYTQAILDRDYDKLHDLDMDFAEWFEAQNDAATIPTTELKAGLGDIGSKVIKALKAAGIQEKRKGTKRSLMLNPHNTDKPFQAEVDGL